MKISRSPVGTLLERLYQSEINFRLETFWDAGFTWSLIDMSHISQRPRVMVDDEASGLEILCASEEFAEQIKKPSELIPDWLARGSAYTLEDAVTELCTSAREFYPDSDFAKWWDHALIHDEL